jgi:hypothetical protein
MESKMIKTYFFLAICIICFSSCEDVIQVDLTEAQERIVIEASILKLKGDDGNNQQIRITKTRGFFEEDITTVEDAQVSITNEDGEVFNFVHDSLGIYRTSEFNSQLLQKYKLRVEVEDEVYTAEETFIPVVEIDSVSQRNDGGFSGEEVELKAYYTDTPGVENYYLFTFFVDFIDFPEVDIFEDEFFDGNTIFALYIEEDLMTGDEVFIQNFGMSKQFYNYMFLLLNQVGTGGGGPFSTPPSIVRGNIINETNPENYPYGYFNLSETDLFIYTVE